MSVMSDFLAKQNEVLRKKAQENMNSASNELNDIGPIEYPGRYLCEVASFAYRDKKKNNAIRVFPELYIANSGSLNLNINLRVIDGTPRVPKGSTIYKNITIMPGRKDNKDPTDETFKKIAKFAKPSLVALTGSDKINITDEWAESLLPKYEETSSGKFKLIKDHGMKNKVMILVDQQLGSDQIIRLVVKNIEKAQPGDKSETFVIEGFNADMQEVATTPAPIYNIVETEEGDIPHNIPEVEDFT